MNASHAPHLVVVGAGIVGLGHAVEGLRRGMRVTIIDQSATISGSSVQNFGHACVTAQSGEARVHALAARERWLDLAGRAGFDVSSAGTHVVARTELELAVLEEFAAVRGDAEVRMLGAAALQNEVPVPHAVGGAHLPLDLQVDPRQAAASIAAWLEAQGVEFHRRTAVHEVVPGTVRTSRGDVPADLIVVAVNHDVDRLFPALAEAVDVRRCRLHMLRVAPAAPLRLPGPVFTGWSLARYPGFLAASSLPSLVDELATTDSEGFGWDVNLMYTPQTDGTILVGDTHRRDVDAPPFQEEAGYDVLVRLTAALFGRDDLRVVERWQGVYATAPDREFLTEEVLPGVQVVTVTTGIGMTTGLGVAVQTLDRALGPVVTG